MSRIIHGRCAVDLYDWQLPVSDGRAIEVMTRLGCKFSRPSVIELVREQMQRAVFTPRARMADAPQKVDCASLMKWAYAKLGLWLPRRALDQWAYGTPVDWDEMQPGDLFFIKSSYHNRPDQHGVLIGHVLMVADHETLYHAALRPGTVCQAPLQRFRDPDCYRGIRRYAPLDRILTVTVPRHLGVKTREDLFKITLQAVGE